MNEVYSPNQDEAQKKQETAAQELSQEDSTESEKSRELDKKGADSFRDAESACRKEDAKELVRDDLSIYWEIFESVLDNNESLGLGIVLQKAEEIVLEKDAESLNKEKLIQVVGFMKRLRERIGKDCVEALREHPQAKKEVLMAFCEPVISGHLTANEAILLVGTIEMSSEEETAKASAICGYDTPMYVKGGTIFLTQSLLETPGKFHLRHMVNHEMSHPLVDKAIELTNSADLEWLNGAERVTPMMEIAEEILEGKVSHLEDALPQHVQAAIDSYDTAKKNYDQEKHGNKEKYLESKKHQQAKEICTDFVSIFFQSENDEKSFIINSIGLCSPKRMDQFLGQNGVSQTEKGTEMFKKILDSEGASKNIKELIRLYKDLFEYSKNIVGDKKIFESESSGGATLSDNGGYFGSGVRGEDPRGFQKETDPKGLLGSAKEVFTAFAEEVVGGNNIAA